ncbi:MAG: preprotein translocase subunit SecG [Candidatus Omnitrophica bacterium]|nr:preprotein translocase subunit SecG [Candidatus Omnitrophota bacterium]
MDYGLNTMHTTILFILVLIVHIVVSLVLVGVILLQGGRGGLSESLGGAAAQSLFGGGVATVLTRITTVCACLFVVTCLSLAYLSTMRGRSVVEQVPLVAPDTLPLGPLSSPQPSTRPPSPKAVGTRSGSEPAAPPSPSSLSHVPSTQHGDASPSQ